jgi:hypothetical protein
LISTGTTSARTCELEVEAIFFVLPPPPICYVIELDTSVVVSVDGGKRISVQSKQSTFYFTSGAA